VTTLSGNTHKNSISTIIHVGYLALSNAVLRCIEHFGDICQYDDVAC